MKNRLSDLNNHLFAQLERLSDEDITEEKLHEEIIRSRAVSTLAREIVNNGNLVLEAEKAMWERDVDRSAVPRMLQGRDIR